MIQRKQSVYLLLAVIAIVCALCLPIGYFVDEAASLVFKPMGVMLTDGNLLSTWGLFALLALGAVIPACTIFLFRNRRLQMRMTLFHILLLVGYYFVLLLFCSVLKKDLNSTFQFNWAICLPMVAIILDWLAFGAIRHDDEMVKAVDRLR